MMQYPMIYCNPVKFDSNQNFHLTASINSHQCFEYYVSVKDPSCLLGNTLLCGTCKQNLRIKVYSKKISFIAVRVLVYIASHKGKNVRKIAEMVSENQRILYSNKGQLFYMVVYSKTCSQQFVSKHCASGCSTGDTFTKTVDVS